MATTAKKMVNQMESWIGRKESNGSHKEIIDIYNTQKPLPRSYKVKYTDSWCMTTVTAAAVVLNALDIIPAECSCEKSIEKAKVMGIWIENENMTPVAGDIIYYDWDDNSTGDAKGWADHVGVVQKVVNGIIYVIEGNYGDAVKVREIKVNAKGIRGYARPKYDPEPKVEVKPKAEPKKKTYLSKGDRGAEVKTMQEMLIYCGYSCGSAGADADFGTSTESGLKSMQKANGLTVDGKYGSASKKKLEDLYNKKKQQANKPVDNDVKNLQAAINKDLKPNPKLAEDNALGSKTKAQMKKINIKKPLVGNFNKYPNIVKFIQKKVGTDADGSYGKNSVEKVKDWQKKHGLTVDGIVGYNTLMSFLQD